MLKGALVVAGVAGVGLAGALPANAATVNSQGGDDSCFPVVPGMQGDRRANELWHVYEDRFNYNDPQATEDAYNAIGACTSYGSVEALYPEYQKHRANGTYPDGYTKQFAPAKDAFAYLSNQQLIVQDMFYKDNPAGLCNAFFHFGEGTLYDPRQPVGHKIHMMDNSAHGGPPPNYHAWHAIIRATVFLGVSPERWTQIDNFLALSWAVASIMKPVADSHTNPPMQPDVRHRLERQWLPLSPTQLDDAFDSYPYPKGIS